MGTTGFDYKRVGRRSSCHGGGRGFRLNPKRFSVLRVRVRLMCLVRLCGRALESLKRRIGRGRSPKNGSRSRMSLAMEGGDCRFRSFGRTNSFYSEAIADCLEFIKRSSLSVDGDDDDDDDDDGHITQPAHESKVDR